VKSINNRLKELRESMGYSVIDLQECLAYTAAHCIDMKGQINRNQGIAIGVSC